MKRITLFLMVAAALFPVQAQEMPRTNPFASFFGEWTLKDDKFQQVWDGETLQTLEIKNHHTNCQPVNTDRSVLCVVDAGDFNGHIFWARDERGLHIHHLSHFGTSRLGTGKGIIDENGDLHLTISFTDEPEGTYREYTYRWITVDEYEMISTQFGADGEPTGNWYGGTFIRLTHEP
ncbi:MAG: hypothetical protein AAGA69_00040 [Pseudomonadota bacterium]